VVRDADLSPPGDSASNVTVTIQYPNGSGSTTSSSTSPNAGGEFSFLNSIPIGLHLLEATASGVADTVVKYVAVYPGRDPVTEVRFPGNPWRGSVGTLAYVSGTGETAGKDDENIRFEIENLSSVGMVKITWLKATYTSTPQAYYEQVKWDGNKVFDGNDPPKASEEVVNFSSAQYVVPNDTVRVELKKFKDNPAGGGLKVDMRGVTFTIQLSNGTSFTFTTPL
ncbi:MAG: hypothetical protein ACE5JC_05225, partial [Candidatus Zixiibacteriota bacterium]